MSANFSKFYHPREASSHPFHKRLHRSSWLRLSGSSGAPFSKSDLERAFWWLVDVWNPPKKCLVYVGMCWYDMAKYDFGIPYIQSMLVIVGILLPIVGQNTPYCWSYNVGCFLSQTWYRKAANQISMSLMKIGWDDSSAHELSFGDFYDTHVNLVYPTSHWGLSPDLSSSGLWPAMYLL